MINIDNGNLEFLCTVLFVNEVFYSKLSIFVKVML